MPGPAQISRLSRGPSPYAQLERDVTALHWLAACTVGSLPVTGGCARGGRRCRRDANLNAWRAHCRAVGRPFGSAWPGVQVSPPGRPGPGPTRTSGCGTQLETLPLAGAVTVLLRGGKHHWQGATLARSLSLHRIRPPGPGRTQESPPLRVSARRWGLAIGAYLKAPVRAPAQRPGARRLCPQ